MCEAGDRYRNLLLRLLKAGAVLVVLVACAPVAQPSRSPVESPRAAAERAGLHAPERLTAEDYARAERFLTWNVEPLVLGAPAQPQWLEGDRFWYRNPIERGHEFVLVDPVRGTRERAFDHERMARTLSAAADTIYDPFNLPVGRLEPLEDGRGLGFELDRRRWVCDVTEYVCPRPATPREAARAEVLSPDGRLAAFRRGPARR
jgi:hypothetical protein